MSSQLATNILFLYIISESELSKEPVRNVIQNAFFSVAIETYKGMYKRDT